MLSELSSVDSSSILTITTVFLMTSLDVRLRKMIPTVPHVELDSILIQRTNVRLTLMDLLLTVKCIIIVQTLVTLVRITL
jgi:hypothetical protein